MRAAAERAEAESILETGRALTGRQSVQRARTGLAKHRPQSAAPRARSAGPLRLLRAPNPAHAVAVVQPNTPSLWRAAQSGQTLNMSSPPPPPPSATTRPQSTRASLSRASSAAPSVQSRGLSASSMGPFSSPSHNVSPLQPDMDYEDLVQLIRPTSISLHRSPPRSPPRMPTTATLERPRPYSGEPTSFSQSQRFLYTDEGLNGHLGATRSSSRLRANGV
jgi:hypothetical protein